MTHFGRAFVAALAVLSGAAIGITGIVAGETHGPSEVAIAVISGTLGYVFGERNGERRITRKADQEGREGP